MKTMRIAEELTPTCMTFEAGDTLLSSIRTELGQGQPVELDFSGVRLVASPFFNAAIAPLFANMSEAEFRRSIIFTGLSPTASRVLDRVVANAQSFYADPAFQESLDRVLFEEAGVE